MTLATRQSLDLAERAASLDASFKGLSAQQMLDRVINGRVAGSVAVISSFGAEAAALLKLVADKDPATPVVFLDTRRHFDETLAYVDDLMEQLGLTTLVRARPRPAQIEAEDPDESLAQQASDRCCYLRKTLPMISVLRNFDCVLTGRKRFQTEQRREMNYVEAQESWLSVNPLADWSRERIVEFLAEQNLRRHPLVTQGFSSIGCEPCTKASDGYREGRWQGSAKSECGIHMTSDGQVVRIPPETGQ